MEEGKAMKYFLRIIVNKDFQFDSEVTEYHGNEFEKAVTELRRLSSKGTDLFLKTNDGKTLVLGETLLRNSIFLFIPDNKVKP